MARNARVIIKLPEIDYSRLAGRMAERHYTRRSLAKAIGITAGILGQWMLRGELMHGEVVLAIADRLEIPITEISTYFFQSSNRRIA